MLGGPMVDGEPTGDVMAVYPCRNAKESSRKYTVDSRDMYRADSDARENGYELIGVWHSHTHSRAYPSETDVRDAAHLDPAWVYVLVSLAGVDDPEIRAYRIRDGSIAEIPIEVSA